MKLKAEHKEILKNTCPFWNIINLVDNKSIDANMAKKKNSVIKEILCTFDASTEKFCIGDRELELKVEDIRRIFGILDGDVPIKLLQGKESRDKTTSFYTRRFKHCGPSFRKKDITDSLRAALDGNTKEDVEDVGSLMTLYMLCCLFMTNKSLMLAWSYVRLVENVEKMKMYNWSEHIWNSLMNSITKNRDNIDNITGCVIALPYWIMENFKFSNPQDRTSMMLCTKWSIKEFSKKLKKTNLQDLCGGKHLKNKKKEEMGEPKEKTDSEEENWSEEEEDSEKGKNSESMEFTLEDNTQVMLNRDTDNQEEGISSTKEVSTNVEEDEDSVDFVAETVPFENAGDELDDGCPIIKYVEMKRKLKKKNEQERKEMERIKSPQQLDDSDNACEFFETNTERRGTIKELEERIEDLKEKLLEANYALRQKDIKLTNAYKQEEIFVEDLHQLRNVVSELTTENKELKEKIQQLMNINDVRVDSEDKEPEVEKAKVVDSESVVQMEKEKETAVENENQEGEENMSANFSFGFTEAEKIDASASGWDGVARVANEIFSKQTIAEVSKLTQQYQRDKEDEVVAHAITQQFRIDLEDSAAAHEITQHFRAEVPESIAGRVFERRNKMPSPIPENENSLKEGNMERNAPLQNSFRKVKFRNDRKVNRPSNYFFPSWKKNQEQQPKNLDEGPSFDLLTPTPSTQPPQPTSPKNDIAKEVEQPPTEIIVASQNLLHEGEEVKGKEVKAGTQRKAPQRKQVADKKKLTKKDRMQMTHRSKLMELLDNETVEKIDKLNSSGIHGIKVWEKDGLSWPNVSWEEIKSMLLGDQLSDSTIDSFADMLMEKYRTPENKFVILRGSIWTLCDDDKPANTSTRKKFVEKVLAKHCDGSFGKVIIPFVSNGHESENVDPYHWTLLVFDYDTMSWSYYNSFKISKAASEAFEYDAELVAEYVEPAIELILSKKSGAPVSLKTKMYVKTKNEVAQQANNSDDCGFYVCYWMECLAKQSIIPPKIYAKDMIQFKVNLITNFLSGFNMETGLEDRVVQLDEFLPYLADQYESDYDENKEY